MFVDCPPTSRQQQILAGLRANKIEPLLDSAHKDSAWFVHQFSDLVHKVFYTSPCILQGSITETNFNLMGSHPDIAVYFTAGSRELEFEEWESIAKLFDACINGVPLKDDRGLSLLGQVHLKPQEFEDVDLDDDLVVVVDAHDYYYSYEYKIIGDDILCQINRPRDVPYLVHVKDYSTRGIEQLFYDIFTDDTWGRTEHDVAFIKKLWTKFMDTEFDIDKILKEASWRQFPPDGSKPAVVHRTSIEEFEKSNAYKSLFEQGGVKL